VLAPPSNSNRSLATASPNTSTSLSTRVAMAQSGEGKQGVNCELAREAGVQCAAVAAQQCCPSNVAVRSLAATSVAPGGGGIESLHAHLRCSHTITSNLLLRVSCLPPSCAGALRRADAGGCHDKPN
jgi:hypothetical protein